MRRILTCSLLLAWCVTLALLGQQLALRRRRRQAQGPCRRRSH